MKSILKTIDRLNSDVLSNTTERKFGLFIFILVFAIYGNTSLNSYSVDDDLIVDGNEQAEAGCHSVSEILTTNYLSQGDKVGSYRAIPRITYALEFSLFGRNPSISHLINVILFYLSCLLILWLLLLLFRQENTVAILFAVTLFALHPLHTEVVASLKNRDELMQLLFSLCTSIALVQFARHGKAFYAVLTGFCFLIALACKESSVQFLAVYPVIFYYAGSVNKKRAFATASTLLLALLGFGLFQVLVLNPDAVFWMDTAKEEFPFIEHPLMHTNDISLNLGTAFYGLGYYIKLFLVPHPLGFFYGYNQLPIVPIYNPFTILSIVLYSFLLGVGLLGLKSRSFLSLGIMILLACLAIFSNLIVQVSGIIAERFAYSSSLGFCMMAGWLVQTGLNKVDAVGKLGIMVGSSLLFVVYGFLTFERNADWKNYLTLANHDAKVFPESAIVHFYLGLYIENNVLDTATVNRSYWWRKAAHEYTEVSRIHPATISASIYAANIYSNELNNIDSAIIMYERLFSQSPRSQHLEELRSYGICLKNNNRITEAIGVFQETILLDSNDFLSHQHLAELLILSGQMDELITLIDKIEFRFPKNSLANVYRGNLALQNNDPYSAISYFEKAIYLAPEDTALATFLISLYQSQGMVKKAENLQTKLSPK